MLVKELSKIYRASTLMMTLKMMKTGSSNLRWTRTPLCLS